MDKYDKAVCYLTKHPDEIIRAWHTVYDHPAGSLFGFAGPQPLKGCGCLTQVKAGVFRAATPALTRRIRQDTRIPTYAANITVASLPVFAAWQRRLDRYAFRRTKRVAR